MTRTIYSPLQAEGLHDIFTGQHWNLMLGSISSGVFNAQCTIPIRLQHFRPNCARHQFSQSSNRDRQFSVSLSSFQPTWGFSAKTTASAMVTVLIRTPYKTTMPAVTSDLVFVTRTRCLSVTAPNGLWMTATMQQTRTAPVKRTAQEIPKAA